MSNFTQKNKSILENVLSSVLTSEKPSRDNPQDTHVHVHRNTTLVIFYLQVPITVVSLTTPLNSKATYIDKTSLPGEPVEVILSTRGLSCCSMICFTTDSTSLDEVYYHVYVSHDNKNWILLRTVECGTKASYDISWTKNNQVFSNIMYWRFVKIWVSPKANQVHRLVLSAR